MAEKKETTALATTLNETQLGQIFVKSGFFADAKDESQAINRFKYLML